MSSTMNITRLTQRQAESGLSGAESIEVENFAIPSQVISAGTEEQTALGLFQDHQLHVMSLLSDQDVTAQFLGVRTALVSSTGAGAPGVAHAGGDLTDVLFAGDLVRVEDTVGNDGVFLVDTVAFGADTTITLVNGMDFVGAEGAVGTIARVASQQCPGYAYPVTSTTLGTGAIVIPGDVSDILAAGDYLLLLDTVANDGYWYIMSVTVALGITTIVVSDPNLAVPVAALPATEGAVGWICKVNAGFELAANVPFLWTATSGLTNPFLGPAQLADSDHWFAPEHNAFRGDVAYCMVNNPGAVNANFAGRIGTNAIIY